MYESVDTNIALTKDAVSDIKKELSCFDVGEEIEEAESSFEELKNNIENSIDRIIDESNDVGYYMDLLREREDFWRDLAISLIEDGDEREGWIEKIEELFKEKQIEKIIK